MMRFSTLLIAFLLAFSFQTLKAGGGPDAYGYVWLASTDMGGPTPMWIDTNANWMQVTGLADDNSTGPYQMFWPFHFYWGDYNSFKIGSNGWISFDNVSNIAHCFPTIPLQGGAGDNYVAPLMSDLNFSSSYTAYPNVGEVWYWSNLKDTLVVTYYNVPWWQNGIPDWYGSNTFQVLFDGIDSSITFTYLNMNSSFTDNLGCASDLVIGIENSTGAVGLQCYTTEFLPSSNFAIKFFYPPTVLLSVKDITPLWNQNTDNGGVFFPTGLIPSLTSNIKNVGNDAVTSTINIQGRIRNLATTQVYTSSTTLPGLAAGQDSLVTFLPQANVTTAGQYYWEVTTTNNTDINPANNVTTSEIVMVNLTGATSQLTYCTGGLPNGTISWNGGQLDDGLGVYHEPPVYPMNINSIDYYISTATNIGYIAAVYDDNGPGGGPGTLLFVDTISAANTTSGAWNTVTLTTPVTITSGGYYVAWFMGGPNISLGTEDVGPISRRSYEILSGQWASYRENTLRDLLIRVNIGGYPCTVTAAYNYTSNATTVNFSNQSVGGTSFVWDFGDGNTSTQTGPSHTYASTGVYTVCLISTSPCGSDTACSSVTVCALPVSNFNYSANGQTVSFTNLSSGGTQFSWTFGDGNTSTMQNPTHTYAGTGIYTACLVASNACDSDSFCLQFNICALPAASFTYSPNANPQSVTFTSTSTGNPSSYTWDFGDGQSSGVQNPTNLYAAPGTYTVCLIVSDTCGSDTSCSTVMVGSIGTNDPLAGYSLDLWPNPAQDQVTVKVNLPTLGQLQLRITDMAGRELFSLSPEVTATSWQQQLDFSRLSKGMYFLEVRSGDWVETKKLMME